MDRFQTFLRANHWNGKHVHTQMKKFALLERRMGGTYSKTYRTLVKAWNLDEGKYWLRTRNALRVIRDYGGEEQRTDAWHAARSTMITASEVGHVIDGTPASRHEVLLRKVAPTKGEKRDGNFLNNPMMWGTVFEPIAKRIYERDTQCTIRDVSCVRHRIYPFLGASPDGIILCPDQPDRHHALVEFKCPKSRKIGGIIPKDYVHQMQMQMECTGVDECEYVEFQFRVAFYTQWLDHKGTKGIFALWDDGRVTEWTEPPGPFEQGVLIYWVLEGVSRDLVERDPVWLSGHLPALKQFWAEVEEHRAQNTAPPKPGVLKLDL